MIAESKSVESHFFEYLAKKVSPAQLSALYPCYSEIEAFCTKIKILQKPLFETTESDVIRKVQRTIEQNKIFRIAHRKQYDKILSAGRYYFSYVYKGRFLKKDSVPVEEKFIEPPATIGNERKEETVESKHVAVNRDIPMTRTEQDNRLMQKYPIIFKRMFNALRELSSCSANGISISEIETRIGRIARHAVIGEVLDNASWSKIVGDRYVFSSEIVDHGLVCKDAEHKADPSETNEVQVKGSSLATTVESVAKAPAVPCGTINTSTFAHYLKDELKMTEATCRSHSSAINNCETFAREHGFSSWRLYTEDSAAAQATIALLLENKDFLEYNAKQHNRFRAALSKFMLFVGADPISAPPKSENQKTEPFTRIEEYASVLKENFRKGFRMESSLEIRRFRRHYSAINGSELEDSDESIALSISKMCLLYDGKAYLPDIVLSEDLKESLLRYIDESFASGKHAVYFQALYDEFSEAFLDYHIHDADMLRAYLVHLGLKHIFFFSRSFISQEADVEMDPLSEIRDCLQEHARPMEYEELFSELPHLPQSEIKSILASNGEFVNNSRRSYFHESSVILSDKELEGIAAIIAYSIEDKEFVGGNELYDVIKAKYPYIIENNNFCSVYGFRDALKHKLGDRFSFKGNIISRAGQELSMADVFANYAKRHDSFSLTELQSLKSELATVIHFESVYGNSLRISREQFVSKDQAQFAIAETDAAIDRVCTDNYIAIQGITNFGVFPYAGFPWNSFLLEHYVAEYSQKYMLLHSSYNGTECAGAIVKRKAGIKTFDDFIVDLLANSNIELNKASALQLLSDRRYLARRRYSNIESLIIQANAQRNRKDSD